MSGLKAWIASDGIAYATEEAARWADIEHRLRVLEGGHARREPIADTRGDSATGFTRQEQRRVGLRKGGATITITAGEGAIRSLEQDGWHAA